MEPLRGQGHEMLRCITQMREYTIVLDQDYRSKKKISWLYNKSVWVSNSKYKE